MYGFYNKDITYRLSITLKSHAMTIVLL